VSPPLPFHQVHVRRPAVKSRTGLDSRQRLALLTVVLLNGLCLSALGWGVYARLVKDGENAGKLLHIAVASSKLNRTSAEPVSLEIPAANETQEPVERTSIAPPTMSVPQAPPSAEPPPLGQVDAIPLALDWEPTLVFSSNHAHHQGDSPMIRNWKSLELAALLAAAFTAQPVLFAGEGGKKDDIKEILKRLDGMDDNIAKAFKRAVDDHNSLKGDFLKARVQLDTVMGKVDELEGKLDKLHAEIEKMRKSGSGAINPTDKAILDEIKSRLGDIEKAIPRCKEPAGSPWRRRTPAGSNS
jgi:hypothetical protein